MIFHLFLIQAERQAVNTTVQGSAADIVKLATVNIQKRLRKTYPASPLSHQHTHSGDSVWLFAYLYKHVKNNVTAASFQMNHVWWCQTVSFIQPAINAGLGHLSSEEPTLSFSCMMSWFMKQQKKISYRYRNYLDCPLLVVYCVVYVLVYRKHDA